MTERQKRFRDEYIRTGNASEAARRAGYKSKNADVVGAQNLVKLSKDIEKKLEEISNERTLTLQEAQEHLASCVRGEITEKIVTPSGKVVKVPVRETERLKALDIWLKVSGAYKERATVELTGGEILLETLDGIWKRRLNG